VKEKELVLETKKCLVTGACGFIGSHLVERLLKEGIEVTGLDNLSTGRMEWLERVLDHPRFRFVRTDLRDSEQVRDAVVGQDAIWHLGANTDIPGGWTDPRLDLENGIFATFNVLEAMRRANVRQILFASSGAVFGDAKAIPTPESVGPTLPMSVYGASKLACEGLISAYAYSYDIRGWIFRFGNVVGARMGHGVIYDFIQKLRRNPHELEILGDGNQRKNYFLVEDCVDGMLFAWQHVPVSPCDVFHLGNASTIPVSEIAAIVIEEMGLQGVHIRYTGGTGGWPGDQPVAIFDVRKMQALGWEIRLTSAEVVRIAVRRLLEQDATAAGVTGRSASLGPGT